MGRGIQNYIQIYLSRLKKANVTTGDGEGNGHGATDKGTTTGWLLSACKHPKTTSFAAGRYTNHHPSDSAGPHHAASATLSDIDRFLLENFNSLYATDEVDGDDPMGEWLVESSSSPLSASPPQPIDVHASQRFFVSPCTSSSLIEEARLSAASAASTLLTTAEMTTTVPDDCVAVMTFSKDPYDDFRRSMQEMVDARHYQDAAAGKDDDGNGGQPYQEVLDWDFMEDLLFCYLELNDRSVHKYILEAFTDLTVSIRRRRKVVEVEDGDEVTAFSGE